MGVRSKDSAGYGDSFGRGSLEGIRRDQARAGLDTLSVRTRAAQKGTLMS